MSPAKLHTQRAPPASIAAAARAATPPPDLSNGADPSTTNRPSTSTGVHDAAAVDTRPTTAQSYHSDAMDDDDVDIQRSASRASANGGDGGVSRSTTLKKKSSLSRKSSLKRSGSRRSVNAGGIKGVEGRRSDDKDFNSALTTPIPTQSSPTDILANRFQAWRVFLKSLITYFREVQVSYETRAKALTKVSNVASNTQIPTVFMTEGGLSDANRILTDYHRLAFSEANKAREIEHDVIQALSGLRADLGAKIKEIKNLHGDFKNSIEKEKESTKRAINAYQESLQHYENTDGADKGRNDPFITRLNVDRMVEKQIDEENYLHRAYINLESSGRELESIVVGEIQKAYNALAGIMKREADEAYNTVDSLRNGPISMQKDHEWVRFVTQDPHLVDPEIPLRRIQDIHYPGKDHPASTEIRAGMLERKSKYLKSYTPGWYVLSPTHIHEFKSADNLYSQPPVMSLYLGDQKLGSHSSADSNSHKFMLKGRQTGGMHRGHSWVFRAESHDTMMAWFDAIKSLTEKTGAEKNEYVRKHARSVSGNSARAMSVTSSDGLEEDEADHVPYSASMEKKQLDSSAADARPQRPLPGGRFPSDLAVPREQGPVSDYSSDPEHDHSHGAEFLALPGPGVNMETPRTPANDVSAYHDYDANPYVLKGVASHEASPTKYRDDAADYAPIPGTQTSDHGPLTTADTYGERSGQSYGQEQTPSHGLEHFHGSHSQPVQTQTFILPLHSRAPMNQVQQSGGAESVSRNQPVASGLTSNYRPIHEPEEQSNDRGGWMGPAASAEAGAGVAVMAANDSNINRADYGAPMAIQNPVSRFSMSTGPSVLTADTDLTETSAQPQSTDGMNGTVKDSMSPMQRHYTDGSISGLHVPGEFPTTPGAGTALGSDKVLK
ncbi:hypothetical protein ANO11243_012570 [Dothideomycetidae sp. 11243]|nr:hypothetical protein ANO11243_012570 [fungal sp. No.11243]